MNLKRDNPIGIQTPVKLTFDYSPKKKESIEVKIRSPKNSTVDIVDLLTYQNIMNSQMGFSAASTRFLTYILLSMLLDGTTTYIIFNSVTGIVVLCLVFVVGSRWLQVSRRQSRHNLQSVLEFVTTDATQLLWECLMHSVVCTAVLGVKGSSTQASVVALNYRMYSGLLYSIYRFVFQLDVLRFPMLQQSDLISVRTAAIKAVVDGLQATVIVTGVYWMLFVSLVAPSHWIYGILFGSAYDASFSRLLAYIGAAMNPLDVLSLVASSVSLFVLLEFAHDARNSFFTGVTNSNLKDISSITLQLQDASCSKSFSHLHYMAVLQLSWAARHAPEIRGSIFAQPEATASLWKQTFGSLVKLVDRLSAEFENAIVDAAAQKSLDAAARKNKGEPILAAKKTFGFMPSKAAAAVFLEQTDDENSSGLHNGASRPVQNRQTSRNDPDSVPALIRKRVVVNSLADKHKTDDKSTHTRVTKANPPGSQEFVDALARSIAQYPIGELLLDESVFRLASCLTKDYKLYIWAVDALSGLVVSAATEDRYGLVNRDVPQVIDALVRLLNAIEAFLMYRRHKSPWSNRILPVVSRWTLPSSVQAQAESWVRWTSDSLSGLGLRDSRDASWVSAWRSSGWVVHGDTQACVETLKTAIYRIALTYYPHMQRFQFSPSTVTKLDRFMEFQE